MAVVSVGYAKRRTAELALERYRRNGLYEMAVECFSTYDPKGAGLKLEKPWSKPISTRGRDEYEQQWADLESGDFNSFWLHKVKQAFGSWTAVGFATAKMLSTPGYIVFAQSRNEAVSRDLALRSQYILENLRGPLAGTVRMNEEITTASGALTLHSFCGETRRCEFNPLEKGPVAWRYAAASLAIYDEAAYGVRQEETLNAARSASDKGGMLIVLSSGVYGSMFNREVEARMARARVNGTVS